MNNQLLLKYGLMSMVVSKVINIVCRKSIKRMCVVKIQRKSLGAKDGQKMRSSNKSIKMNNGT